MLTTIQCRLGLPLPPKFIIFPFASPQISLPLEDIPPPFGDTCFEPHFSPFGVKSPKEGLAK